MMVKVKCLFISSENKYIATVSANGLIAAQHIGTTYIDVNEETRIEVTVKPLVTAFVEPPLLFGATRSEVIAKVGDNYSSLDDTVLISSRKI